MTIHCKTNSGQQIYVFKFASQTSRFIPVKNYKLGSFFYTLMKIIIPHYIFLFVYDQQAIQHFTCRWKPVLNSCLNIVHSNH